MNDTPQLTQPPSTTATSTIPASHTTITPVMSATSVLLPAGKTFSGADFGRRETLKAKKAPADAGFLPTPPSTSPPPPMASARLAPAVTLETQVLPPFLAGAAEMVMASRIAEIAQGFEDEGAFFVGDLGEVWKAWKSWKTHLPRVELFYGAWYLIDFRSFFLRIADLNRLFSLIAVKCNPDPLVLQLLALLGTGFDCASQAEIINVLSLPSPPDASRIIFANPCKPASFVRSARAFGVDAMTFDNKDELVKIAQLHPGARLVLRILTDDSKSLCRLGLKFGAPVETCPALLALARSLNLDVIGVSFHVGSGCKDPQMFEDAVVRARSVFEMGRREGYAFDFLDIGGGFEAENFVTTAEVLSGALERHFPLESGVRIIGEPGRFLVSSAFTLATNIIARRAASARINPAVQSYSGEDSDEELGVRTPVSEGDAEMDFMTSSVVSLDGSLQGSQHLGVAGEDADESGPKVMCE